MSPRHPGCGLRAGLVGRPRIAQPIGGQGVDGSKPAGGRSRRSRAARPRLARARARSRRPRDHPRAAAQRPRVVPADRGRPRRLGGDRAGAIRPALRPEHPPGHGRHEPARARLRLLGDGRDPHERSAGGRRGRALPVGGGRLRRGHDGPLRSPRRGRLRRPQRAARRDQPHPVASRGRLDRDVPVPRALEAALRLGRGGPRGGSGAARRAREREHDVAGRPARGGRQGVRRHARGRRHLSRDPARHVLRAARPLRLRQDDDPADDRRLRGGDVGADLPRRPRRRRPAAVQAGRQHGLPELRALPPHDGCRQRRVRAAAEAPAEGGGQDARRRDPRARRSRRAARVASRASSPAASSSASRSRERS